MLASSIRRDVLEEIQSERKGRPGSEVPRRPLTTSVVGESTFVPFQRSARPSSADVSKRKVPSSTETAAANRMDRILDMIESSNRASNETPTIPAPRLSIESPSIGALHGSSPSVEQPGPYCPSTVLNEVKTKMLGQQMEIEEQSRMVSALKKELEKARETNVELEAQHKEDLKTNLSMQRKEYEIVIKRHLGFIDKLLVEKDELTKKCDQLSEEVKSVKQGFKEKTLEDQQAREMRQQKEMWQASEKIKRDKWIAEKTKAIKDQTVKGLEPEIQRMITQHKLQIRQLEERYKEEALREKSIIVESTQRQLESMRGQIVTERQKAAEEEREYARQRYQKQAERDEMEFQQQRRKAASEFEDQKQTLMDEAKQARTNELNEHRRVVEELRRALERGKEEAATAVDDLRRKNASDMASLKERLAIEKEEWQTNFMVKCEAEMRNREKQFRDKLVKERDAELEMIVQRLESETDSSASDIHRRHRIEVEKIRSDAADEIKQLRDQHSQALDKVIDVQNAVKQLEDQRRELQKSLLQTQHELKAKETMITQQRGELGRLKVDETTLSNAIRNDFEHLIISRDQKVGTLEEHINKLESDMDHLRSHYESRLEEAVKDKESALDMVEDQVRKALMVKDELCNRLKSQLEDQSIRNKHLSDLIEKQRKELLG
ncbi:Centrosomal protein of 131 kDa [Irineochytrium annulatum]|nr:Centrosomal protein of 131 kDa [Irineochytrium annulatum]